MITGADHIVLLVNDLNLATETFRGLGFETHLGGEHPATGSHNALIALSDGTYIEILAFKDPALAEISYWGDGVRRLRVRAGFGAYALGSDDLEKDLEQLRGASVRIGIAGSNPGSRLRPDGQTVAWRSAFLDGSPTGVMPFLIQDETPRTLRIEPPAEGLGALARVNQIVVAAHNVETAQEKYRALLNAAPRRVHNTHGDVEGYRFTQDWGSIILASSNRAGNALTDQLAQQGEGIYAITLSFANLGDAWASMHKRGIELERDANGYLIPPTLACGARIRLGQR
jgi:hypothetical protein